VLNSESIVIIRIKGEHLLYSKISGGMIGYGWGNVCYIVNFPPEEYLLYNKVSEGNVSYAEGLLYDTELLILPEHLVSPWVYNGICAVQSLVFYVICSPSLIVIFRLVILLFVLRITASYYLFGIYMYTFFIDTYVTIYGR
jgi:hypothetical protein